MPPFLWGVLYGGKYNSSLASFTKDDSLLPGYCVVPPQHVLSGWWCGPPEGGWLCPCLRSQTVQWSSSTWPALGVPSPPAAAHMGCETTALQWQKEYCINVEHWGISQFWQRLPLFRSLVGVGTTSQEPQLQTTVTEAGQSSKAALSRVEGTLKLSFLGLYLCFVYCTVGCNEQFSDLHCLTWNTDSLVYRLAFTIYGTFAVAWCRTPFSSTIRFQVVHKLHHSLRSSYVNFLFTFYICMSHLNTLEV